jgi:hypothetical protein
MQAPAGPGAYVFAIRNKGGPGIPWYVGISLKEPEGSLVKESLTVDKLRKYAVALAEAGSGLSHPLIFSRAKMQLEVLMRRVLV